MINTAILVSWVALHSLPSMAVFSMESRYKRVDPQALEPKNLGHVIEALGLKDDRFEFDCADSVQIRRVNAAVPIRDLEPGTCSIENKPYLMFANDPMKIRSYTDSNMVLVGVYTRARLTIRTNQVRILLCRLPNPDDEVEKLERSDIIGAMILGGLLGFLLW